jgi:mono/diheme cytochrome c family protein
MSNRTSTRTAHRGLALLAVGVFAAGCNTDMWRQPRQEPLDASEFFADGQANRPLVPGTIARGHAREDAPYFTGVRNGRWVDELPMPVTMDLLKRGQERFQIYCTPCHGQLGDGNGMIAKRGFALRRPVGNYHTDRLRNMPVGHFYDVITNGYGAMYSYASRIEPQDRWAVVAYIRALQLSQNANIADADPAALEESTKPKPAEGEGGAHTGQTE